MVSSSLKNSLLAGRGEGRNTLLSDNILTSSPSPSHAGNGEKSAGQQNPEIGKQGTAGNSERGSRQARSTLRAVVQETGGLGLTLSILRKQRRGGDYVAGVGGGQAASKENAVASIYEFFLATHKLRNVFSNYSLGF